MRKAFLVFAITSLSIIGILGYVNSKFLLLLLIFVPLILMGFFDMYQSKHTIRNNFPLLGRMRYLLEELGPELRQYFIETDTDGKPFNRLQRGMIYQRSKNVSSNKPFGTQLDVYDTGYEWINHSMNAIPFDKLAENPRIKIGSSQCAKPYYASMFNISAMSYGSLSKNAVQALNAGAKMGDFFHNTGEGGLSRYHFEVVDVVCY
ncbi:MAG: FMN-binding glutamate synthase family protein, partial [Flavobacterium sp.]|nr:FMN-binding glutamate synthase family protein [Flavobacterium sp.]